MTHTAEDFTSAINAAVEHRGQDWRYPRDPSEAPDWFAKDGRCRYKLADGTPACIVGDALARLDLLVEVGTECTVDAYRLLSDLGFSESVAFAASQAQDAQDGGETWGDALQEYLAAMTPAVKSAA